MNVAEIIKLTLQLSLILMALSCGLKATPADAFYLFRKPRQLLRSILAMNIIMPLVAIALALIFELPQLVKVSLFAISVSPLAPLFPKQPLKAGGRNAYVIGLMVAAAIFSVILIPVTMFILGKVLRKDVGFSTTTILTLVLITVIIPLLLGIGLRHFFPVFAQRILNPITKIAPILLLVSLIPILFMIFPSILRLIGNGTILVIATFVVAGVFIGHFLGGSAGTDRTVLALATAARHPAIALSVATANLTDHSLVPATMILYLLINAFVAVPYLKWLRKE